MKTKNDHKTLPQVVRVPVEQALDLHTFDPRELEPLLDDYLREAYALGHETVRLIHGKGRGVLRSRVRSFLARHPLVLGFHDAPPALGSWGATVVHLASGKKSKTSMDTAEEEETGQSRRPSIPWWPLTIGVMIGLAAGAALLCMVR